MIKLITWLTRLAIQRCGERVLGGLAYRLFAAPHVLHLLRLASYSLSMPLPGCSAAFRATSMVLAALRLLAVLHLILLLGHLPRGARGWPRPEPMALPHKVALLQGLALGAVGHKQCRQDLGSWRWVQKRH